MNRLFGMMPPSEIEETHTFEDDLGLEITIEAGPNGWSIIYADGSSEFKDNPGFTTEANYREALTTLRTRFDNLVEI